MNVKKLFSAGLLIVALWVGFMVDGFSGVFGYGVLAYILWRAAPGIADDLKVIPWPSIRSRRLRVRGGGLL